MLNLASKMCVNRPFAVRLQAKFSKTSQSNDLFEMMNFGCLEASTCELSVSENSAMPISMLVGSV